MDGSSHAMLFDMLPAPFAGWRRRLVGRADSNEPSGPKMRSSGSLHPLLGAPTLQDRPTLRVERRHLRARRADDIETPIGPKYMPFVACRGSP